MGVTLPVKKFLGHDGEKRSCKAVEIVRLVSSIHLFPFFLYGVVLRHGGKECSVRVYVPWAWTLLGCNARLTQKTGLYRLPQVNLLPQ